MFKVIRALKCLFGPGVRGQAAGNTLAAPDSQPSIRKAPFVKPELISHGDLVDVTAPFGGTLTPTSVAPGPTGQPFVRY